MQGVMWCVWCFGSMIVLNRGNEKRCLWVFFVVWSGLVLVGYILVLQVVVVVVEFFVCLLQQVGKLFWIGVGGVWNVCMVQQVGVGVIDYGQVQVVVIVQFGLGNVLVWLEGVFGDQ